MLRIAEERIVLDIDQTLATEFRQRLDILRVERFLAEQTIPLTDADRLPWLEHVAASIGGQRSKKQPGIITCSAFKRTYRQIIIGDRPEVRLVYLRGGRNLVADHLAGRHGHFMSPAMLRSQIDTLEEPDPSEDLLTVDLGASATQVADEIIRLLGNSAIIPKARRRDDGGRVLREARRCHSRDPTMIEGLGMLFSDVPRRHFKGSRGKARVDVRYD
jgi:carbohydrate kinase (thermoresistant glucokinase family)